MTVEVIPPIKRKRKRKYDGSNNEQGEIEYLNDDKWVDANRFVPIAYDLVYMRMENRTIIGWWAQDRWYARKMKDGEKVKAWKKKCTRNLF